MREAECCDYVCVDSWPILDNCLQASIANTWSQSTYFVIERISYTVQLATNAKKVNIGPQN